MYSMYSNMKDIYRTDVQSKGNRKNNISLI